MRNTEDKTILAIDDDETVIAIVQNTLQKHGYNCITATNGEDGLQRLQDTQDISAIILDIKMPGMDGDEVLTKIRTNSEAKNTPVLMLTGQNSLTELSELLSLGANDYITKPFDPMTLITRLKIALY